jgi:hypothetical protein
MSGPIWPQYYRFWKHLWHRLLHNMVANRRKARNTMQRTCRTLAIAMGTKPWSQNPKRMQSQQIQCKIPAENWQRTCRVLIIITNARPEIAYDIFLFSKQRQLQQTTDYKIRWRRCARHMAHEDHEAQLFRTVNRIPYRTVNRNPNSGPLSRDASATSHPTNATRRNHLVPLKKS